MPVWAEQFFLHLAKAPDQLAVVCICVDEKITNVREVLGRLHRTPAPAHLVVLMGYDYLTCCADVFMVDARVDLVVFDEAKRLRDTQSVLSQLARYVCARARLCLTATPIDNHIWELYTIPSQACPTLIRQRTFGERLPSRSTWRKLASGRRGTGVR